MIRVVSPEEMAVYPRAAYVKHAMNTIGWAIAQAQQRGEPTADLFAIYDKLVDELQRSRELDRLACRKDV